MPKSQKTQSDSSDESRGVKVIHRVFDLLDILAQHSAGLTLVELSQHLKLPKSTTHRLLQVLIKLNAIREAQEPGRYMLGYLFLKLSEGFLQSFDWVQEIHPRLEKLNQESNETVHLGVLDDACHQVIHIARLDSPQTVRVFSRIGRPRPVHATALGKAMLSCFEPDELIRIFANYDFKRFTPNTITDIETFMSNLIEIRERRYALDQEEGEANIACIAAPICNSQGKAMAAVSISMPVHRLDEQRREVLTRLVVETTAEISNLFSYILPSEIR